MTEIKLIELSMADVLRAIEAAPDLSASKKTHWSCSVSRICIAIGRPPENIPGRWSAVNSAVRLARGRASCTANCKQRLSAFRFPSFVSFFRS